MVKVRIFLFVVCFAWMLFDEIHGDVQIFNESDDGNGQQNVSVNIHGSNGGNICIDCQNQIQVDSSLGDENPQGSLGDLQPYMNTNIGMTPFFYAQPPLSPIQSTVVVSDIPEYEFSEKHDAEIPTPLFQLLDHKKSAEE